MHAVERRGAYRRKLRRTCDEPGCTKTATYVVINRDSEDVGQYCAGHSQQMVDRLNSAPPVAPEEWRTLDVHPSYDISSHGRFRHHLRRVPVQPRWHDGHWVVDLAPGVAVSVATLVLRTFVSPPGDRQRPIFLDGHHDHCTVTNLRWSRH